MRRRYKYLAVLIFVLAVFTLLFNMCIGLTIIGIELFLSICYVIFKVLNFAVKQTNWYKNIFIYTRQMCSNQGYRSYLIRNLDIVNVGSNPARFAFHYDNVLGENWSTGNQGKDMDFEILKFRHSFLKRGGIVLLPILPFSGLSGYLKENKPEYLGMHYYAKFAHTLDWGQAMKIPECRKAFKWMKYPLFYEPKAIKYLLFDQKADERLTISEMPLMKPQLIEDARHFWEGWLKEFDIKLITDPFTPQQQKGIERTVAIMQKMIDYLVERDLKPVIVLTPMAEPLQRYFTQPIKKKFIYDFIEEINRPKVVFLDYSNELELQDTDLYFNALFMNLRGRKLFTQRVLADLKLI